MSPTITAEMTTRRHLLLAGASLAAGQALAGDSAEWRSAAPASQGLNPAAAAATLKAGTDLPGLRALQVARRGVLVGERNYGGAGADSLLAINSATKSVCSMLFGQAMRDGHLKSLDDSVAQLIPDAVAEVPDSPAASITLRLSLVGRMLQAAT